MGGRTARGVHGAVTGTAVGDAVLGASTAPSTGTAVGDSTSATVPTFVGVTGSSSGAARRPRASASFSALFLPFGAAHAFYQSQLANVLAVNALSKELKGEAIAVNLVYPGIVHSTMIKRHMGVDKSKVVKYGALPLMSFATISPSEAASTVLFLLMDRSVTGETGKMYTKMSEIAIKEEGLDEVAAQKVVDIGDYWSGLKSKDELLLKNNKAVNKG